jgi:DNA-binding helix-hairpin-helix protein with protein kinase domain
VQRLKSFPRAGWTFQIRAAQNLAAAFDEVHKAGCLVGDVNQGNAFVSTQALVWIIDCDSFQMRANGRQYLCEVGTPHYTPPELQGMSFRGLVRTENHDRFGLAVLLYQLLFVGRHPYAGVYLGSGDPSFEQLIREYRFSQGPTAHANGMDPPPHTPTFADISPELGALFRRAFERGGEAGSRPRAAEWIPVLRQLEQACAECAADAGHKYWRKAGNCVWCRLAANGGPEYYFGVAGGVGTFAVDEAKLRDVLKRLHDARPMDFRYERDRHAPTHALIPEPPPEGLADHAMMTIVLGAAVGLCLFIIPFGLFHGGVAVVGFLGVTVFGVWLAILRARSPWHREYRRRKSARDLALDDLRDVEEKWDHAVQRYRQNHFEISNSVQKLVASSRGLASQHQAELQRLRSTAEAGIRLRFLRLHLLADADIPKIGAGRKHILARHNILTAADVEQAAILRIKGFAEILTVNLMTWKKGVLQQFRFDPATGVPPGDLSALVMRLRTAQNQFHAEMDRQLVRVESLAPACRASVQSLFPALREAVYTFYQASADLEVLSVRRR